MKKLFKRLMPFTAFLCAFSIAFAVPALADSNVGNTFLNVNSGPGYCGFGSATSINNTDSSIYAWDTQNYAFGSTYVTTNDTGCTDNGNYASLPADYLEVQVLIQCKDSIGDTETVFTSAVNHNSANTGSVTEQSDTAAYCLPGDGWDTERAYVRSWYYTYPSGWSEYVHAGSWVSLAS